MKKISLLYSLIIFALLTIFFIILHPIAIFDTDDWAFIHHLRLPIPVIGAWNPIKVFPEITMSFFSYAGAYVLYPITGRYCYSLSITNGLFICFMITIYFLEFFLLICKKYDLNLVKGVLISTIFICLHFTIVTHIGNNNIFLFYAYDLTCIYHYTLSTVVNASLVMHMIRIGGYQNFSNQSKRHKTLIAIWTYFAIFSSLYTNVIIAVYIGVELLVSLIDKIRSHQFKSNKYCLQYKNSIIILIIWLISLAIEVTGGRSTGRESNYLQGFFDAFTNIWTWFALFNPLFLVLSAIIIVLWIKNVKNKNVTFVKYFLSLVLTSLYLILLSSVVDSSYVTRIDVIFAADFWLLLILMLFLIEILPTLKKERILIAGLTSLSIIGTIYSSVSCKEINYINIEYKQCEALTDDIINQFKTAEGNGETEIDLLVPKFDNEINWPYGLWQADDFSKAMYRHRITHDKITVRQMIPSMDKTHEFITP